MSEDRAESKKLREPDADLAATHMSWSEVTLAEVEADLKRLVDALARLQIVAD